MNISSETLDFYIKNSRKSLDELQKDIKDIKLFMSGNKQPTFGQVSDIARKLNIPTGLLMLDRPVEIKNTKLDFRTLDSIRINTISEELRDTIVEMETKQDFLREEIDFTLDFIKSFSINDDILSVAMEIRKKLQVENNFYKDIPREKILNFLKEKISNLGVFIFFNGKVGDNTHRPLSLEEFRGFVLTDDKAPIIFINQRDESINGKIFTLIHELVHLFIGTDEIFTEIDAGDYKYNKTESFVNKVTAEFLVPAEEFIKNICQFADSENIENKTQILAKNFCVSEFVIIRRLYDLGYVDKTVYLEKAEELTKKYQQMQKKNISSQGGGNYNNNLSFRIDKKFFNYVQQALQQNKISYTDAFRIIGVSFKGYAALRDGE